MWYLINKYIRYGNSIHRYQIHFSSTGCDISRDNSCRGHTQLFSAKENKKDTKEQRNYAEMKQTREQIFTSAPSFSFAKKFLECYYLSLTYEITHR